MSKFQENPEELLEYNENPSSGKESSGIDQNHLGSEDEDEKMFREALNCYSQKDYQKSRQIIEQLSRTRKYKPAQYFLGWFLRAGVGGKMDNNLSVRLSEGIGPKALEYFERMAELAVSQGKRDHFADFAIGRILSSKNAVVKDFEKAMFHLQRAADAGNADAVRTIGWMFRFGIGVPMSKTKALEYLEKSAEIGSAIGHFEAGEILEQDHDGEMETDLKRAFDHYKIAAEMGNPDGMSSLAEFYLGERHAVDFVEPDEDLALKYLTESADLGSEFACLILQDQYFNGENWPRNEELALHYAKLGARLGDPDCMYEISAFYMMFPQTKGLDFTGFDEICSKYQIAELHMRNHIDICLDDEDEPNDLAESFLEDLEDDGKNVHEIPLIFREEPSIFDEF